MKLTIVGGTYYENCNEPHRHDLFGSGLRAVAALSDKDFDIAYHSCAAESEYLNYLIEVYNFEPNFTKIPHTIEWDYFHPLSIPQAFNFEGIVDFPTVRAEKILYYGMLETRAKVEADYLVYDPQNHISLKETGSTYNHLALILNKNEALLLTELESTDLVEVGKDLLRSENAEIVVIKNGASGALVFEGSRCATIPVFETTTVWPIGTGDIFSAAFAWHWLMKKKDAFESALQASKCVAQYCETQHLPLSEKHFDFAELKPSSKKKKIYLAGPFFTIGERFLINEFRDALFSFGNDVFSPMHDAGYLHEPYSREEAETVANEDIKNIVDCDALLAIVSGTDPGTLFEIGFAHARGKQIVIFQENVKKGDMFMLSDSSFEITNDISTAVYKVSW